MTRLFNDPTDFLDELVDGFVAASGRWVRAVPGRRGPLHAVARAHGGDRRSAAGPATTRRSPASWARASPHGAAMGNLFASPSTQRAYSVAKAADQGRRRAVQLRQLRRRRAATSTPPRTSCSAEGIDCRTVLVTDDICERPAGRGREAPRHRGRPHGLQGRRRRRRGGRIDLDEVERLARHANDRTRSFGVAFDGCTLPGAAEPLFTVPRGADGGRAGHPRRARHRRDRRAHRGRARRAVRVAAARRGARRGRRVRRPRGADPQRPGHASSTRSCSSSTAASTGCSAPPASRSSIPRSASSARASTWPGAR